MCTWVYCTVAGCGPLVERRQAFDPAGFAATPVGIRLCQLGSPQASARIIDDHLPAQEGWSTVTVNQKLTNFCQSIEGGRR